MATVHGRMVMIGNEKPMESTPLIYCKSCYHLYDSKNNQYNSQRCHPCLFCENCLNRSKDNGASSSLAMANDDATGMDNSSSIIDNTRRKPKRKVIKVKLYDSLFGKKSFTATKCGFCNLSGRAVVKFCYHCQKCLCQSCCQYHDKNSHYRYHASTDILNKNGLLV